MNVNLVVAEERLILNKSINIHDIITFILRSNEEIFVEDIDNSEKYKCLAVNLIPFKHLLIKDNKKYKIVIKSLNNN